MTRGLLLGRVGEHEHGFMLAVEKLHGWQVGLFGSELEDCGFSPGRVPGGSVRVNGCSGAEKGGQGMDRAYSCTVMSFQARLGGIAP